MRDGKNRSQGLTFPTLKHMQKRLKGFSEVTERRQVGDAESLVNSPHDRHPLHPIQSSEYSSSGLALSNDEAISVAPTVRCGPATPFSFTWVLFQVLTKPARWEGIPGALGSGLNGGKVRQGWKEEWAGREKPSPPFSIHKRKSKYT